MHNSTNRRSVSIFTLGLALLLTCCALLGLFTPQARASGSPDASQCVSQPADGVRAIARPPHSATPAGPASLPLRIVDCGLRINSALPTQAAPPAIDSFQSAIRNPQSAIILTQTSPTPMEQLLTDWLLHFLSRYPWLGTLIFIIGALRLCLKPLMSIVEKLCATDPARAAAITQFEAGPVWTFILWLFDYLASVKAKPCAIALRPRRSVPVVTCVAFVALLCLCAGCVTKNMVDGHYIYSVTSRGLGLEVTATDASTQTPKILLGAFSSTVTAIPTETNGTIVSPNYANNLQSSTSLNPFNQGIDESLSSGNYQTQVGTNISTQPIVPKLRPITKGEESTMKRR